jgi:hypothetical protein
VAQVEVLRVGVRVLLTVGIEVGIGGALVAVGVGNIAVLVAATASKSRVGTRVVLAERLLA